MMTPPPEPLFDRYADRYRDLHRESIEASGEEPDYFAAYKAEYMAASLRRPKLQESTSILDFGCGIGNCIPHLERAFPGAEIHGVDVSGASIEVASALNPNAVFARIDGAALPLPDDSIDIALAACVYHHIAPKQRLHWSEEIRRVLKPGGHFFLFEHNPLNPLTRRVVNSCPFDDDAILLPGRESLALLQRSGFSNGSVNYVVFFPKPLSALRPLEKFLVKLPLGAQYVAHGRA